MKQNRMIALLVALVLMLNTALPVLAEDDLSVEIKAEQMDEAIEAMPEETDGFELEIGDDAPVEDLEDISEDWLGLEELELEGAGLRDFSESVAFPDETATGNESNPEDFEIVDGVLVNYKGDGGDVVIPDGVTSIGDGAFEYRDSLKSVSLSNSVKSIGNDAFIHCRFLTSVSIPDSVTSIGSCAFKECYCLASVSIPDSVTSIGSSAFLNCDSLTSVSIPDSVTRIEDDTFGACDSLTSVSIPDSVTSIGQCAFSYCAGLISVSIPNSVKSIGDSAFSSCDSLTSVSIADGVTSIGYEAFYACESLTSISIPDSVTSIGDGVFKYCYGLTSISMPYNVTSFGNNVFEYCTSLTNVSIPNGATSIGECVFSECRSLTSVSIPDSVTSIGQKAFSNCYKLISVSIPDSVTSIGSSAFVNCVRLTSVSIPESVTSIGNYAFEYCTSLTNVSIADGVMSIGKYAFSNCYSLTSVSIPESVTSIGDGVFGDRSLSVTIYGKAGSYAEIYAANHNIAFSTDPMPTQIPTDDPDPTSEPTAQPVDLIANDIILGVGETVQIVAADSPVPASDCTFGTYNPDVAVADENGIVTGRRVGKTTITVTTNRGVKATCKVQVKKAPSKLELSRKDVILAEGDSFQLKTYLSSKSSSRITWTSSEDFVTVDDNGVVTAKKLGTIAPKKYATVKASTYNGLVAKCKVTVAPIPESISFIQTALELGKKESWKMEAFVYPKGSVFPVNYLLKWTSSNEKVATVDDDGNIKARGLGKAKITARIKKGPKAVCTVTVKAAPGEIMLNKRKLTLRPYDVEKLRATLTKNSASNITWTSSNEQVATIDKEGNITARKTGTTTITARTFNKKKAKCTVEVRNDNTVHYRALLIAEGDFSQHGSSPEKKKLKVSYTGAEDMQKMLKASVGPSGGKWETTYKKDQSNVEISNLIRDVLGKAKSNDVSLFYIASHGDNVSPVDSGDAGAIKTTNGYFSLRPLASTLANVKGKVIVIIDACGSGAAVYASNDTDNRGNMIKSAAAFDASVVAAFSDVDRGLYVDENGNVTETGETRSNAGDFRRENKFYVLTACDAMEDSLSDEFVKCLTKGVNKKKMPADTNKDGVVTLNELYKYISSKLDNKEMKAQKKKFYQHVQVYPKNCEFGLFKRK